MEKLNNGYADYYYMLENGNIYDSKEDKVIKPNKKHLFKLRTVNNKISCVAQRPLYKSVYN